MANPGNNIISGGDGGWHGLLASRVAARPPARSAFTLIELMVVMFIISILIALIVGVARYIYDEAARKETQSTQAIVMLAIQAYYDKNIPPQLPTDGPAYPTDKRADPVTWDDDPNDSIVMMLECLTGRPDYDADGSIDTDSNDVELHHPAVKAATATLMKLPKDAFPGGGTAIYDGFGNRLRYKVDGGLGGRPVLISAGPDGKFDTEDDIRSDEH